MTATEFKVETFVKGKIRACFDAALDVELHVRSMGRHREKVVRGRKQGLLQSNETVTWEAVHFGVRMRFTAKVIALKSPVYFRDEMIDGPFRDFYHDHLFESCDGGTKMIDIIKYSAPFGWAGEIFNRLVLKSHMIGLIESRNRMLKSYIEENSQTEVQY